VASPAYEQLLVVQGHDTLLDQLRYRHANNGLRNDLALLESDIVTIEGVISEIEDRRHALDRERKRLDDEVAKIQAKRDDINAKLYDGSITATKDLLAMQEEAKSLAARQTGIEDEELEFMEQIESVSGELRESETGRQGLLDNASSVTSELETMLAEIETEVGSETELRAETAASVPPELLSAYDKLRADLGGVAVAKLNGAICDGCHMTLSAVTVDRAKKAPQDAVISCDECGRLLIV
jgi:predicted  nucleic acid-binding Zn-ribbon protein